MQHSDKIHAKGPYHWNREENFLASREKTNIFHIILSAQSDLFIRRYFAIDVMLYVITLMPFIFAMV